MSKGLPVLAPSWIHASLEHESWQPEANHVISLQTRAKVKEPLLQGKRVFVKPGTQPNGSQLSSLILLNGGQPVTSIRQAEIVISPGQTTPGRDSAQKGKVALKPRLDDRENKPILTQRKAGEVRKVSEDWLLRAIIDGSLPS